MNAKNFTKWFEEMLLPNLDGPSAIVMDNASYHSMQSDKCPTSNTRKADIQEWLRNRGIPIRENLLKPQLLELARANKPPPSYVIDQLIRQNGHEVLRLQPYHPEFNAIELIWSQQKHIVRQRNVTFRACSQGLGRAGQVGQAALPAALMAVRHIDERADLLDGYNLTYNWVDTQGMQPMTGTGWAGGASCLPAALMAVRHINEKADLLDGYNLTYNWVDTQCNAGLATYKMFETLNAAPTKIMLLGCGCSTESEATAQASHLFNITQLSSGSSSPILSDRNRFPNFFRLAGPDQKLNPAKIAVMREFNWKKVATINQALEFFSVVIDDFVKSVKGTDISIVSQEIFEHDPLTRVENLKQRDARIIITACYEDKARLLLCHAYRVGLYGPKIVWIFNGWFSSAFWRRNLDDIPCSADEMETAADGTFLTSFYFINPSQEPGIAGLTVSEFTDLYHKEDTYDPAMSMFDIAGGPCYDHIWVAALALNCTDAYMKKIGHLKTLNQFTYNDRDINDIILSCISNVSMTGITGKIAFGEGSDPIKNVKIERIQGGQRVVVGSFLMDEDPMRLEWNEIGIQWKGGNIPRDSTYVTFEEMSIPLPLYIGMTTLAGIGILLAILFLMFNIHFRKNKIVKLSSPNVNNILLLGCVLTYCTVFMKSTGIGTPSICTAKVFCFSLGFTTAFGSLFSKTWRVYKIFTNKKLLKMSIKDYQLFGMVGVLSGVVIFILAVWEILSPQQVVTRFVSNEKYMNGNDAEVHPFVRVCFSKYSMYFGWTIYILEGALLTFGAFLSWETRQVKIEALNDSRQIGVCIYNVVVLSAVALTLTLLLEDQVIMMYGVTSGCILIGTTTTQLLVFMPKVVAVYKNNTIDSMGIHAFGGTPDNTDASKQPGTGNPNTATTTAGRTSDC